MPRTKLLSFLRNRTLWFGIRSSSWVCVLFLTGCVVVPVKAPTVITNPSGQKTLLPSETMIPGETTREQVEARYKAFGVDCGIPNFFWGRFQKSNWAIAGATYGGAGAFRMWGGHNLLASFDGNGTLKTSETVPDKELPARFAAMRKELSFPALDIRQPIIFEVTPEFPWILPAEIQISATDLLVTMDRQISPKRTKQVVARIPVAQVMGLKVAVSDKDSVGMTLQLVFSEKTAVGKKMSFLVKPEAALTLVRWIEQGKGR
jgi:hypothetical protein